MAEKICDISKENVDNLIQQNKKKEAHVKDKLLRWARISEDKLKPVTDYLKNKFDDPFITAEQFDEALNAAYGKKDTNIKLAIKLQSLLQQNEAYWTHAKAYILTTVDPSVKTIYTKKHGFHLDALPESVLKNLLTEIGMWAKSGTGENWGVGLVGNFITQINLPGTLGRKEKTASFYKAQQETKDYPFKLSSRINDFMQSPKGFKSKRDYGWTDILHERDEGKRKKLKGIEDLAVYFTGKRRGKPKRDIIETQRKLVNLFIWSLKGDARNNTMIRYNDKIGDFEVSTQYFASGKKYRDPATGKETGGDIYVFGQYVPLKTFRNGKYYLPLAEHSEVLKTFEAQKERFRALDDELLDYVKKNHDKSVKKIRKSFSNIFGLTGAELDFALFGVYPPGLSKDGRKSFEEKVKDLSGDKWDLAVKIKDTISGVSVINQYWSDVNQTQKKRNHYPAIYDSLRLPDIFTGQNERLMVEIEDDINPVLNIAKSKGIVNADTKMLNAKKKAYIEVIKRNIEMINRMDEMDFATDSLSENQEIPFIKNQVHMKRISNTINPFNMRSDSSSYRESLVRQMSAIERNLLIANMIKQLGRAKSDAVRDLIINNFKVPFGFTDVKAKLGPVEIGTDDIVRKLGKINIKIKPHVAQRIFKWISSFTSAQYLSGLGTVIQNKSAYNQNIVEWGWKAAIAAKDEYYNNSEMWYDFIQRSGVLEFRDFFSKSLTSNYIHDSIELDVHQSIMGAVLEYHSNKRLLHSGKSLGGLYKNAKKEDLEDILREQIADIIESSPNYIEWSGIIPSEERAKARKRIYKRKKAQNFAQKYVDWAITRDWEFKPLFKNTLLSKAHKRLQNSPPMQIFQFYNNVLKEHRFTMSTTEEYVRTISFIIGVQRAKDFGIIPNKPINELKGDDFKAAIEIGRLHSLHANFGLTPQDFPGWMQVPLGGGIIGKFRGWSSQKFGRDFDIIKRGIISLKTPDSILKKIENKNVKKNAIAMNKKFDSLLKLKKTGHWGRDWSKVNPEMNKLKNFLLLQGTVTLLTDLVLFGPIGNWGLKYALRKMGLPMVAGMRSDLLSLIMFFPLTLPLRSIFDDEEDDTTRWALNTIMRNTFAGFYGQKMFNVIYSIVYGMATSDTEELKSAAYETFETAIPFRGTLSPILREVLDVKRIPF